MRYNIAIVGAGLIGRKRAWAIKNFHHCRLVAIVDINQIAAKNLAKELGVKAETDWRKIVKAQNVDIIIVSVFNKFSAPISIAALKNCKHVLCEKPLGRNAVEAKKIIEVAATNKVILKTGFNHRHHPAISQAKRLFDQGKIGKLCFMRCRYGHGGRPGYKQEWRAKKNLAGGGELLDQGVHVVDLFRWFAGDFDEVFGYIENYFWKTDVEDNAFAIFKKSNGMIATLHTSWTQWKNLFSLEIFGREGYLIIEGLGGSYGIETLRIGKRKKQGGPPHEKILSFPGPDRSWELEWKEFISAIKEGREPIGNGWDGYQANRMIDAIYRSSRTKTVVRL